MDNISSEVDRFIKIKNLLNTFIEKNDFRRVNQYYQVIYQNNLRSIEKYDIPLYEDAVLLRNFKTLYLDSNVKAQSYIEILNLWLTNDEGFLIYILLGDYWAEVALQYDLDNPEFSELIQLFTHVSTYWYLRAIADTIHAPDIYLALMHLYEKTNQHCDLNLVCQHYRFDPSQYSAQALNIFYQQNGVLPPQEKISLILRVPTEVEKVKPCLYWFNLSIERQPSVIAFSSYCNHLLDKYDSYEEIDNFLYSSVCQEQSHLLLQQLYYLRYIHEFKALIHETEKNWQEKRENGQELICYFNTLVLNKKLMADCYVQQILFFCSLLSEISTFDSKNEYLKIQENIFQLIQSILQEYSTELQSNIDIHHTFFKAVILFFADNRFPFIDKTYIRGKILALMSVWNNDISFVVLLYALRSSDEWQISEETASYITLDNIWEKNACSTFDSQVFQTYDYLYLSCEYDILIELLEKFANYGHTPSMMYLFKIYSGSSDYKNLNQYIQIDHAEQWLARALALKNVEALLVQGRRLLTQSLNQSNEQEQKDLARNAQGLLEQTFCKKSVQAEISYGYAQFLMEESQTKQSEVLRLYFPMLMENNKFNKKMLAEIAYIYAFASYYGKGIEKNLYLAYYWGNNAMSLDPDEDRYKTLYEDLIKPKTGWFIQKIQYKKRIRVSREHLPEWMKKTIPLFERHLVFE